MSCANLMFSLFLLSPCESGSGTEVSEAVASAISNPQRPAEDIVNDANRKPDQVLSFFNIKPGMTVLDLFSGGGYYTEMLNFVVGENGKVIAHTNEAYIPFSGEIYQKRYLDGRLAQTTTIISEAEFLHNANDDHTLTVFDPSLRKKTDRFVFRFVRN